MTMMMPKKPPLPSPTPPPPPPPPPLPPPSLALETKSSSKVDPLLFTTLQQFWQNYTQAAVASDDSETDLELKQHWLRLFLCYFQFVSDEQLERDEAFKSFFNLIPEEICSFLLEQVYEIISKSDLFSPPPATLQDQSATTLPSPSPSPLSSPLTPPSEQHFTLENAESSQMLGKRTRHTVRLLRKKHNFAQLILSTPSDCNKIVALRNFLTHELGQHLLQFLLRVDIKLIASQKSLCNLCVNLFPNCSWGGADCRTLIRSSIFSYVGNLSLFYQQPRLRRLICEWQTVNSPTKVKTECQQDAKAAGIINSTYITECETEFNSTTKSSDDIADLLVRLLAKCVANECESTLSEQSMSVTALNFALDALRMPANAFVGGTTNETAIKLSLLRLVELSLNNLFANAENVGAIQFPYVFVKLATALENNSNGDTHILFGLIFIIFGVLHNLVAVYSSRNPNVLGCAGGGPRSLYVLKLIDANVVDTCVQTLKQRAESSDTDLQQLFGAIFSMLLRIIDHLNDYDRLHVPINDHFGHSGSAGGSNGGSRAYSAPLQRLRAARRKSSWRQQHCLATATPSLSCSFQGALIGLLPHLNIELQQQAVRYLMRAGTCCCHYTLATYSCCLDVAVRVAATYQRCAYKFLHRKLLSTVFVRDEDCGTLTTTRRQTHQSHHHNHHQLANHHHSHHRHHHHSHAAYSCAKCDTKSKSPEFHTGLLELYRQLYMQKLSAPNENHQVTALSIFLQHLRSIAQLLTHELAAGVLAEIVLPIFRQQKAAIINVNTSNIDFDSQTTTTTSTISATTTTRQNERLLHECLCIFTAYLGDIRLIKAFYNEENIAHLEELLAVPALIRGVCDLIKLGIDNLTFLGDNPLEQTRLSRRLITLQLGSSRRGAQLFQALLKRLQANCHHTVIDFWLDNTIDDDANDFHGENHLSALDILNIVSLQWTLNYELLRTSQIFCQEFAKIYAITDDEDDNDNTKMPQKSTATKVTKPRLNKVNSISSGGGVDQTQSIAEVLKLNFNALHCFLLLPPVKDVHVNDIQHKLNQQSLQQQQQQQPEQEQHEQNSQNIENSHIYILTPTSITSTSPWSTTTTIAATATTTAEEHKAIDCLSSSLEAFVISNMPPPPPPLPLPPSLPQPFTNPTTMLETTALNSLSSYATAELCSTCTDDVHDSLTSTIYDSEMESYDSLISRYYEPTSLNEGNSFLHELQESDHDSLGESIAVFDIRRHQQQEQRTSVETIGPIDSVLKTSSSNTGSSLMSSSTLSTVGCTAAAASAAPSNQNVIGKLFRMFGSLLTAALYGDGADRATPQTPTPEQIERERRLADEAAEMRECFYQANGDGKKLLLKLFEATMAICLKGYQNEEVEKMENHLRKLKTIILSNAGANWHQHAEQQQHTPRDNPVLQTLQALLRIAEIAQSGGIQPATSATATAQQLQSAQLPYENATGEGAGGDVGAIVGSAATEMSVGDGCDMAETAVSKQNTEEQPQNQLQSPPAQPRARAGSYLLPPASLTLSKRNDISYGMRTSLTSATSVAPTTQQLDSDADDMWSDAEQELPRRQLHGADKFYLLADDAGGDDEDEEEVEGGYEADAEVPAASDTDAEAATAADMWTAYTPASRYRTHVLHDGLCRLVVELLMELAERCVRQPSAAPGWCDSLAQLANRLYVIRDCLGGPLYLLRGFAPLLSCNDGRLRELQQSILELVTELHTPDLLCAYYSILAAPAPPVDILVKYLHYNRLSSLRKAQASYELEFPIILDGNCVSTADVGISTKICNVRNYHLQQQTQTPFTRAPCIIPLTHARLWSSEGLTLSLWMQVNGPPKHKSGSLLSEDDTTRSSSEEYPRTHIVSFGTNLAMLSVYVNSNMQLVFETCRPNGELQTPPLPPPPLPHHHQQRNHNSSIGTTHVNGQPQPTEEDIKMVHNNITTPLKIYKALINFKINQMSIFHGSGQTYANNMDAGMAGGCAAYYEGAPIVLQTFRLTRQRWTHLAFAVQTHADGIQLSVFVDGLDQHVISLPFRELKQALRANHDFQVIALGDGVPMKSTATSHITPTNNNNNASNSQSSSSSNTYSGSHTTLDMCALRYSISTLLLFNRYVDNRLIIANLTALGPNYSELTPCQVGGWKPNYGYLNVSRLQRAHFGNHAEALKHLRQARILSYTAQQPDDPLAYKDGVEPDAITTYGIPIGKIMYGELIQHQVPSLQTATILSGGLATLLYLFARVVELNATSATQSMALDLLLSVAHADAQLYAEFLRQDYANLIGYVVRTERCAKDVQLLRAIINNACTQPLILQRSNNNNNSNENITPPHDGTNNNMLYVQENTVACLVYPRLIVAVLQRYADWHRNGAEHAQVLEMLLNSVLALTRDKHPHRDFNMEQLSRAGFVRQLLNLCKVHLIESLNPVHISVAAARAYVNVLAVFAGSPPSPSLMDEIMKLLLLLHRAAESFITHDRANFYFLLSADKPPAKERTTTAAQLGNRMASSVFQRRQHPGVAKAIGSAASTLKNNNNIRSGGSSNNNSNVNSSGGGVGAGDLDAGRAARIERLRRIHSARNSNGNAYRRSLYEFEETLQNVADCSRLNHNALRLLSPTEVTRWRLKYKRVTATTAANATVTHMSPKMLQRSRFAAHTESMSTKSSRRDKATLLLTPNTMGAASPQRYARKRARLQSISAPKRLRTRAERNSDSSLQSLAATLALANVPSAADDEIERNNTPRSNNFQRRRHKIAVGKGKMSHSNTLNATQLTDFHSSAGVVALQEGLLTLLKDFLYLLPDNAVEEVLRHYVKLDYLLVLANHRSCAVRAAIIRLLSALTKRLPAVETQNACAKLYYAHHLANQLSVHATDAAMFLACIEWVTGLYGGTIEAVLAHLDGLRVHQRFGINALLAVAAKSATLKTASELMLPLPAAAFKVLRNIYLMQPEEQTTLLQAGLLQCCVRALYNLYERGIVATSNVAIEEAVLELLATVGTKALKSAGQINLLCDILNMLAFYQERQSAAIVRGFRAAQAQLLLQLLQLYFGAMMQQLPFTFGAFKMPQWNDCTLPSSEMRSRFDFIIDHCVQFFTAQNDIDILVHNMPTMTSSSSSSIDTERSSQQQHQQQLHQSPPSSHELRLFELLATYGIATNQRCNNFIAWGLLPSRPRELRVFIVDALWRACRTDSMPAIICDGKMLRSLLLLCLLEDLEQPIANLQPLCARLGIHENESSIVDSVETEHERVRLSARAAAERRRTSAEGTAYKLEDLAVKCYESALMLTRRVTELQNAERKLIMGHLRDYDETASYAQWLELIRRMTHEGAAWYSPQHSENSWELDDTEGPSRVHTRLRRCHLDIDQRFIMQEYADTTTVTANDDAQLTPPLTPTSPTQHANNEYRRPLDYLLAAGYDQQLNIALNSEQVLHNFPAKYLPVDGEIDGELIVTEQRLYFAAMHHCRYFCISCDVASISEIWHKRYQHQEKAFEIFLDTNRSLLFSLQHQEDWRALRELFCDKFVTLPDASKLINITQQWREGMLTNWEYLMTLNQLAGRTYNDLMQYPVFPWILANYTSEQLDLTDTHNYRLLHKPIAVQHESNEQHYITNYTYINSTITNMGSLIMKPYHYSSHYSNSGTVLHFLVRVPPFTSYFLRYQDNNFDLPDRTFHALNTTWNLASRDSPTDVKELIPEFFCLPEMFENFENLNFGCRQSGERVEDVQLPPWCRGDPRLFVLIHRQALESEAVRYNLHAWIDLIFGHKQMGEAAVEAINVFHPATYPVFLESEEINDPIERKAVETMVRTYGQMPRQLFKTPHAASRQLSYSLGQSQLVVSNVRGLRWGIYAGSPQLPPPKLSRVYELNDDNRLSDAKRLIGFSGTNVVYALKAHECIMQGAELDTYNVVSWGHSDRIVRIEPLNKRPYTRARNLLYNDSFDEITACGVDPNCNQLWFGHKSGRISVYRCTAADSVNSANSNRMLKTRQSYVRGLYMSYNSAFRKITNSTTNNTKVNNRGDTDCDESSDIDGAAANSNINAATATSATVTTTDNGVGGATSAQQRESGTDLIWSGPTVLVRHTDEITCITLSVEFKIAVTAGRDGMAVIWDLNDWRYVRTIERPAEIHQSPISLLAISPTLGDIVTVHTISQQQQQPQSTDNNATAMNAEIAAASAATPDECFEVTEDNLDDFVNVCVNPNGQSILRLHSVNARYVQHVVHEDRILAVCFSYIKEGVGVNCIATAVEHGIVRLWSSWNLNFITQIEIGNAKLISITYSTHQHLVVLTSESHIQIWETDGLYGTPPKFPQIAYK